jgi:hypothetical protein
MALARSTSPSATACAATSSAKLQAERRHTCRRKLDRQRIPVEPAADFLDQALVGGPECEALVGLGGALRKQPGRFGGRQRPEAIDRLAQASQRCLAGYQDACAGHGIDQCRKRRGQFAGEMLRSIQDDQNAPVFERSLQSQKTVAVTRHRNSERERDGRGHVVDRLQRLERNQGRCDTRMLALDRKDFAREPRLPDARGPHEGDEPFSLQCVAHGAELDVAADELARVRCGCAMDGNGRARRRRRFVGAWARRGDGTGHGQVQPVTEPRHGADCACAQDPAQARDLGGKVVLVYHEPRPDALEQCRLGHEPAGILRQHEQQVECPSADLDRLAIGAEPPIAGVDFEGADPYQVHPMKL